MRNVSYILMILAGLLNVSLGYAESVDHENQGATIRFEHQTYSFGDTYTDQTFWNDETIAKNNTLIDRDQTMNGKINQYDATISYPLNTGASIYLDIGVNIRHIEVDLTSPQADAQHISTTVPMLYATALFDLPYEGLSASFEGSHIEYDDVQASEYRAQFNYTWESGLGLQGGWQHQQLNIEAGSDFSAQFETKGPFLDLNYRF